MARPRNASAMPIAARATHRSPERSMGAGRRRSAAGSIITPASVARGTAPDRPRGGRSGWIATARQAVRTEAGRNAPVRAFRLVPYSRCRPPKPNVIPGSSACPRPRSAGASSSSSPSVATPSCRRRSLVPAGDQTLLFTNSGMVQFKEVLTGAETRSYKRAVDYQRVLRVAGKHNDFEEVGRTTRHHTFFEMLGNWSFGDYFKREAIHFAWDFLTRDLAIPSERLAATTYKDDEVARAVWRDEIGLPPERMAIWGDVDAGRRQQLLADGRDGPVRPVQRDPLRPRRPPLARARNASPTTPRTARAGSRSGTSCSWSSTSGRTDGCRCRSRASTRAWASSAWRASSSRSPSNFDTDLFTPIHARMRELLGHDPDAFEAERFSYQVIADHARAITFLIADGVLPSNEGRGYVLRRIVRRAVRHGRLLGPARAVPGHAGQRRRRDHGRGVSRFLLGREADVLAAIDREEAPVRPDARRRRPATSRRRWPARPPRIGWSAGASTTCRPTRRSCPATSPSASTTRTASRST